MSPDRQYRQRPWRDRRLRKWVWLIVGSLAMAALLSVADRAGWFGRAQAPDMTRYDGKSFRVVKVVDGDTLDVDIPDGQHATTRVRLWGVDTPETKHPSKPVQYFGPEATAFTRRVTEGQTVRLEVLPHRTRGTKGRLLAYVHLPDGKVLNAELIATGHGFADPRFDHPHKRTYAALMANAREQAAGMWADPGKVQRPDYLKR